MSFLRLGTPLTPPPLPSACPPLKSSPSPIRPCPTLTKRRGPITLTLPRSHASCTFRKKAISSQILSVQFYTVCANSPSLHAHLPTPSFSDLLIPGLLVVLFFRCITALFNPTCRRGRGIKWGLVSYTTIVFLVGTVVSGMGFNIKSDSSLITANSVTSGMCCLLDRLDTGRPSSPKCL